MMSLADGGATEAPPSPEAAGSFGGFSIGAMQLALPMTALREVLPCEALMVLPCPAACVIGGISLRGVSVPVVDLRIVLGRPVGDIEFAMVVVMVHGGKMLGLLADAVTGVFAARPGSLNLASAANAAGAAGAIASVFRGGVNRADTHELVSVLDPEAISRIEQVPMVEDPEPARQAPQIGAADSLGTLDRSVPMMLLRCGQTALAIPAMVVHTTLSSPPVERSVLSRTHCRGTIAYDGRRVPAIDLQSLCGFGALDPAICAQAFIVLLPDGPLAFLVGAVIDVVRTMPEDITQVPAFALPEPSLVAGALPISAIADQTQRAGIDAGQYLVIDSQALMACETATSMSKVSTAIGSNSTAARGFRSKATAGAASRTMITYLLGVEKASALDQVSEILALPMALSTPGAAGDLLGFIVDRGRSIPVLCLANLVGDKGGERSPRSSVLVVESNGELVGFAVSELKTIEQAQWEPGASAIDANTSSPKRGYIQQMALVGQDEDSRMLPLLDLREIARTLQTRNRAMSASLAPGQRIDFSNALEYGMAE